MRRAMMQATHRSCQAVAEAPSWPSASIEPAKLVRNPTNTSAGSLRALVAAISNVFKAGFQRDWNGLLRFVLPMGAIYLAKVPSSQ